MGSPSFTRFFSCLWLLMLLSGMMLLAGCSPTKENEPDLRKHISINDGWYFMKYDSEAEYDHLIYDVRPEFVDNNDNKAADAMPTEAVLTDARPEVLKRWIQPSGNAFIKDPSKRHIRPEGNPGHDFPFVQNEYDDSSWEKVNLPHDWAIDEPFFEGWDALVGGGMGRLPSHGVAWYRKKLDIPATDAGKSFFLDVDGAMSYAMVWLNGQLAGGWPYGYNSWRLDLTPYIVPGGDNQLAIRLDNPPHSARWYPGGGIYRNVWLTTTNPIHVAHWGTYVTARDISASSATIDIAVTIDNDSGKDHEVKAITYIYTLDTELRRSSNPVASFPVATAMVSAGQSAAVESSVAIQNPRLWGPPPTQTPNLYEAITRLHIGGIAADEYVTRFGIRSVEFDPAKGILVNGEHIPIKGVNQHHDLGALGAAFNKRAAERQLEILCEMGCNAIRTAHNPPAPELLELTDRMGFLVVNEIFDVWERKKTPLDFHLIFPDWHEQDTRAFIRRDRNCPSVIIWSFGNEVGEQYTGGEGAALARRLHDIIREEDPTRHTTTAMNFAKPWMPFPETMDVISLNYQGAGIRNAPAYSDLVGIRTPPMYPAFHEAFPGKVIISSETASALSTRGTYLFSVYGGDSAPVMDGLGGDPEKHHVSAYELYTANFGSSADRVFASQDKHPYVAGEFVWTGWDYLGEPTPYYLCRSSYSGIIDLAGFKKDRFYLYQSRWRPDLPMAHILPHWNWPERTGEITPVHVFTSGDEAELFLNGYSLGRKRKGTYEYRLRWDSVRYEPGEINVVTYKNGEVWAKNVVKTTGDPARLTLTADRTHVSADGKDLSFIEVRITDKDGLTVPVAENMVSFSIEGPGELIATDNGNPCDMIPFSSTVRPAFGGLVLAVIRSVNGQKGNIRLTASSDGLDSSSLEIISK